MIIMEKEIQFETLIDVRSDAFADYWSSIIGKLPDFLTSEVDQASAVCILMIMRNKSTVNLESDVRKKRILLENR